MGQILMRLNISCNAGDFAPIAPMRDVNEGTAARPGKRMSLLSARDADDYLKGTITNLDQDLKVTHHTFSLTQRRYF